ncbi:MAG TPA: hypothetical protein VJY65_03220 [Chloroflexota bacterium]|nr:hypothetical protein [Chloroflexota bacterium]
MSGSGPRHLSSRVNKPQPHVVVPLTLATKRYVRIPVTLWAGAMVVGGAYAAAHGVNPFAGAPSLIRLIGPLAMLAVVCAWVAYAIRLQTVLRIDAQSLGIRRVYPPLDRTYAWADLREWKYAVGRRGSATLRLTFHDGRRVTIDPTAYGEADQLLHRLEVLLPGQGERVRVGRRSGSTVEAT